MSADEAPAEPPGAPLIAIDHPRFREVDPTLFTLRFAPDCMTHRCAVVADEAKAPLPRPLPRLDACCQYGCDVDLAEREAIRAREAGIRALLRPAAAATPWFDDEIEEDADYPSGKVVRTTVLDGGCVFLSHDARGCAIHRAALEQGWDFRGVKPAICRLFPVSYERDAIVLADEYDEYSCAFADGPSLYRLTRDTLGDIFGADLVTALDAVEAQVLGGAPPPPPRRLPLAPSV
jgi:Fe-S-cluster containining protein